MSPNCIAAKNNRRTISATATAMAPPGLRRRVPFSDEIDPECVALETDLLWILAHLFNHALILENRQL